MKTIEANIRMDIVVDGVEFSARGRYEEQAVERPLDDSICRSAYRLDLNFLTDAPSVPGSEPNRMTVVCQLTEDREKDRIWQYKSIEGVKTLSYIRIAALDDAMRRKNPSPLMPNIGEIRNLGGLSGQIRQIEQLYEFKTVPVKGKLDGETAISIWKVSGVLRQPHLDNLVKAFGGLDKKKRYPSDLPLEIEIHIGTSDFFPYRIRYYNRRTEDSSQRSLLLETSYYDVRLNGEKIPEFFSTFGKGEYPEGVFNVIDETDNFKRSLGL